MESSIQNRTYREIVRRLINLREYDYCSMAFKKNANEMVDSLRFARGYQLSKTSIQIDPNDMSLFDTLAIMHSLLSFPIEIVNPSP